MALGVITRSNMKRRMSKGHFSQKKQSGYTRKPVAKGVTARKGIKSVI